MSILVIATRNQHKVGEIQTIFGDQFHYLTLNQFERVPEVIEDAGTFTGNATKKAVELAKWLCGIRNEAHGKGNEGKWVLADDSGLEVDALDGAPGVNSARFAALDTGQQGNSSTVENNAKLLRMLRDVPLGRRTARFRCVLALTPVLERSGENASPVCTADEFELNTQVFEGVCEGRIVFEPRGNCGFGYDPLFMPLGYDQTFGELSQELKNSLSHRGKALGLLRTALMQEAGRNY